MKASIPEPPPGGVAAFVGIDWADQKRDVILRPAAEPAKVEHQVLANAGNAVPDWINQLQQRFGPKGKVLVCPEQSRSRFSPAMAELGGAAKSRARTSCARSSTATTAVRGRSS